MASWRLALVLRNPGTTRLVTAALIGRVPDSISATAIVVLARSETGSYSAAGLAAGAFGLGSAISAPVAGRALDRLGQRRVLPVLAVAFAAALGGLTAAAARLGDAGLAALALAAGLVRPPIEAGLRAAWPGLVQADQLDSAYALDSTLQELIWIGGPLLLAGLLTTGDPWLPLLACAVLCVAGTAGYATSPRLPAGRSAATPSRSPLRSARLRVLLAATICYGGAAGILNVALVAYASWHGGAGWAGVLIAVWGAGSLAGGLFYGSRTWTAPVHWRAVSCLALFSIALLPLAAAPSLPVLALLMIPLGLPLSPWLGSLSASVQAAVPAAVVTEAFTWTFAVITAGMAGGSAAAGLIIQRSGPAGAFLGAGVLGLAGATLAAAGLARSRGVRSAT